MSYRLEISQCPRASENGEGFRYVLSLALFFIAVWVGLWLGRDLNWDFLNYHFYGASLLVEGRLQQDYFAASLQSYLNPIAYIPQYLMIRAGWHSQWIGAVLAAVHALNVLLAAAITRQLLPEAQRGGALLPFVAGLLALLAPLFLTTTGTSFSDPTTSVLVLAALWLLLDDVRRSDESLRQSSLAGLLLGIATGLKMTNSVLVVGIAGTFLTAWLVLGTPRAKVRIVALLLASSAGWLLTHGYWSLLLWREFGNPLFPLFNSFFGSPDFPAVTYRDERFVAAGPIALLTLPFDMLAPVQWLYAENAAVDVRFAAFVLILVATFLVWVLAQRLPRFRSTCAPANRSLVVITAMFFVCFLLWGLTTRIGRYALPLWLLLGPLIVAWSCVLLRHFERVVLLVGVILLAQLNVLMLADNPRWSPAQWSRQWLEIDTPPELVKRPVTLFTLGTQSYSAVVPFLHSQTRVVNLVGQYVQPTGVRMTTRLRQLVQDSTADRRVAFRDLRLNLPYDAFLTQEVRRDVDAMLSVYGLRTTGAECQALTIHMPIAAASPAAKSESRESPLRPDYERLHICSVEDLDASTQAQVMAELAAISNLFDAVEVACGPQLNPHGGEALRGRNGWMRVYFNSLNSLITDGKNVFVRPFRSMTDVDLGAVDSWVKNPRQPCPRLPPAITRIQ